MSPLRTCAIRTSGVTSGVSACGACFRTNCTGKAWPGSPGFDACVNRPVEGRVVAEDFGVGSTQPVNGTAQWLAFTVEGILRNRRFVDTLKKMSEISKSDILSLSVPERIQLAEDIWDSVTEVPESVQLTTAESEELERRLEAYHEDPGAGSPWDIVKQRLRSRA